jgi:hypothetical protein
MMESVLVDRGREPKSQRSITLEEKSRQSSTLHAFENELPTEFLEFFSQRLNLDPANAVNVLGQMLTHYESDRHYEIQVLDPQPER